MSLRGALVACAAVAIVACQATKPDFEPEALSSFDGVDMSALLRPG